MRKSSPLILSYMNGYLPVTGCSHRAVSDQRRFDSDVAVRCS
jgi:hypothetical protein